MKEFNQKEQDCAVQIITAGLIRAAESLSFFMKDKVTFEDLDYYDTSGGQWKISPKKDPNIHLLITEIIGELKGMCCLIFTEEEADLLRATALPKEIRDNAAMMAEMSDAIMLEADNIISASVITEFSNILKHKIFGGVPSLRKLSYAKINEFISNENAKGLYSINFKTHFKMSNQNFHPEFLWLLDMKFIESIRAHSASENVTLAAAGKQQ